MIAWFFCDGFPVAGSGFDAVIAQAGIALMTGLTSVLKMV